MEMNPVVHFEMPAEDRKRMAKFYTETFGWKAQMLGEDMGDYVLVTTTEVDEESRPKQRGAINGGFFSKDKSKPMQYPSVVIAVNNIKDSMNKVKKSGGKVLGEPMEIPGYGLYVSFTDTEGNRVSMMQPAESWQTNKEEKRVAKAIFVNLAVKDLEKSKTFFTKLGFTFNPHFTDKNAACMIIGDNLFSMLISEEFFTQFTKKEIANARKTTEVITALAVESRKKVDEITHKAIDAGGKIHRAPEEHGWMYGQSFEDIDGHVWEVFWMDEKAAKDGPPKN